MTTQIEKANENVTALDEKVIGNFTKAELATLQSTIARETTKEQFNLFIQICVNSGLNPFLNHIHCITYKLKSGDTVMSVQVAVEGVLHIARKQPGFKGVEAQLVHENDDFKLGLVEGQLTVTQHDITFPRGAVVGGYSIAKREEFHDVLVLMEKSEVEHLTKGRNSDMWKNYFADMFKKHMIKRSAKLQFGIEINDDIPLETGAAESESFDAYKPGERKEINENDSEKETIITIGEGEEDQFPESELMQQQWEKIQGLVEQYGLSKPKLIKIIADNFNAKPDDLTLQNLAALVTFVEVAGQNQMEKEKVGLVVNDIQEAESLFAI